MPSTIDVEAATMIDSLVHATVDGSWINGRDDASVDRLLRELAGAHVERACLVGIAGVCPNDFVLETARAHPASLIPVAGFDPTGFARDQQIDRELGELVSQGFTGVKLHPRLNDYDPLHPGLLRTITAAGRLGIPVFLDTLFRQSTRSTRSAADVVDEIATRCPQTRIILLHGGGSELLRVADVVKVHPQLILDVSFTIMEYQGSSLDRDLPYVFRRLDRRTCLGSDMPEFTPRETLQRFRTLTGHLSAEKQNNILSGTLASLFRPPNPAAREASA